MGGRLVVVEKRSYIPWADDVGEQAGVYGWGGGLIMAGVALDGGDGVAN